MKKAYLYLIALLVISFFKVGAQQQLDPLKENIDYTIDNLGDGHVQVSRTFNASQWDNYKKIGESNWEECKKMNDKMNTFIAVPANATALSGPGGMPVAFTAKVTNDGVNFKKIYDLFISGFTSLFSRRICLCVERKMRFSSSFVENFCGILFLLNLRLHRSCGD